MQSNRCKTVLARQEKKLDALIINKRIHDGVNNNPNSIITNLSNVELNKDEICALKVGLKHGLLIRPRESEKTVLMEDVYDQIFKQNILKDDHVYRHRTQTALTSSKNVATETIINHLKTDKTTANENLAQCLKWKPQAKCH